MKHLGLIHGERVSIHFPERRSLEDVPGDPILFVGERQLVLHDGLPFQVHRAIPQGLMRAQVKQFEPLVDAAILFGLLK